jgi:hypothetical protein
MKKKEYALRQLKKLRRAAAVSLTAAGLVMAFATGSAMAEEEGIFSPANQGVKWSGSITIYKDGGSAKVCTFPNSPGSIEENFFILGLTPWNGLILSCTGGTTMRWAPQGVGWFNQNYYLEFEDRLDIWGYHTSPYGGNWFSGTFVEVPFTNGSGLTPSKIVFNKTYIGLTDTGAQLTVSGNVNVTTNSGGLLTLSH